MAEKFLEQASALENAFFAKVDQQLLEQLRDREVKEEEKALLEQVSGIHDLEVLEELVDLGITARTLTALSLVPLILVAWGDGRIQTEERRAIDRALSDQGVEGAAHELVVQWLKEAPGPQLRAAWEAATRALLAKMEPGHRKRFAEELLERTRAVARAAGGLLGLGAICSKERELLDHFRSVLSES